jgi:hypothetical protein
MKTIIYSLIAIFIFGIIAMGFIEVPNTEKSILIECTDSNVTSVLLSKSVLLITNRLKDFSSNKSDVKLIPEKNQIQVTLTGKWDINITEKLLTNKGTFGFYETYNRKNLAELLNGDDLLFSLLNNSNTYKDTVGEIGCTSLSEVEKINDYLKTLKLENKCKFAWDQYSEKTGICLYALKINSEKGALIAGTDVESVKFKTSKYDEIEIKFKKSAVQLWADATKNNLNKTIAVVTDNIVIAAPLVRQEMNGGDCSITGAFTQTYGRYFAAIGNNGELPLSFKVVK